MKIIHKTIKHSNSEYILQSNNFSNKVLFNKIFDIDKFNIGELEVNQSSIYPMTGIARLIFISNNNIDIYSKEIKKFSNSIKVLLVILYIVLNLNFFMVNFLLPFEYKNYK